jgi:signal transduction histidine kinase
VAAQSLRYYRNQAHEACDMRESIGSAVTVLRRKIEAKGIQLRNEVRHAASLGCSEFEFRQIVLNLLGNAIDAVEPLGTVAIRSYQRNGNVELLISDDGPGIAESVHGRLFEPFVTSKGAAGTGLGLWITKGLVTKHGGSLRVRSSRAVRRGTTFRVSFPVAKAGAAAKAN